MSAIVHWVRVVDVGAGIVQLRRVGEIDKHGEELDRNVDVWFQPEPVDVLAVLYA